MARAAWSRLRVAGLVVVVLAVAVMAVVLRTRLRCTGSAGPGVTAADVPPTPARDGNLRIANWNIRNFPFDERPTTAR
jgi:hypothetical protein